MCLSYQYYLPQGYSGKPPGTLLQHWGPGVPVLIATWVNVLGCRLYKTGNQSTKPLLHPLGGVILIAL